MASQQTPEFPFCQGFCEENEHTSRLTVAKGNIFGLVDSDRRSVRKEYRPYAKVSIGHTLVFKALPLSYSSATP